MFVNIIKVKKMNKNKNFMNIQHKGKFIVLEGPHASGKTTQAKMLYNYFNENGIKSIYTKEPYNEEFIKFINIHVKKNIEKSPVLLFLIAADRYLHMLDITSWLQEGYYVISDRYILSGFVYQSIQDISYDLIKNVNYFIIKPNITFYLDVPLCERKRRLKMNNRSKTFFLKNDNLYKEQNLYKKFVNNWDVEQHGYIVSLDGQEEIKKINSIIIDNVLKKVY